MRVIITDTLVTQVIDSGDATGLHRLLSYTTQASRHLLIFESDSGLDLALSTFSEKFQPKYRNLITEAVREASTYPSSRATIKIDAVSTSIWDQELPVLTLQDALRVLEQKITVLVENAENDWNFLLGILKPRDRQRMMRFQQNQFLEPSHGGGSDLGSRLDDRIRQPWTAFRTFVMFDSDRLHPDEFASSWSPQRPNMRPASCHAFEWEKTAKQHLANRYWMLRRRFIESYMPKDELLNGATGNSTTEACNSFFEMEQNARWYYNMKNGFKKDDGRDDKERVKNLYDNLSPESRELLHLGFGGALGKHYKNSIEREFVWDVEARSEADMALTNLLNML